MGLFSRHPKNGPADEPPELADAADDATGDAADGAEGAASGAGTGATHETDPTQRGPWDVADVDGPGERIDFGALWLPKQHRITLESAPGGSTPIAAAIDDGGIVMRVQAFAAPKSAGIWDEIREELAEQAATGDGDVHDIPGPFGRELLVTMPGPGGRRNNVRFWGVDGPRWFLRAVLTGPRVLDEHAADRFADIFADIVVTRGTEARAPRELLELRPPEQAPADESAAAPFDPMHRGPEITEVR